MGQSAVIHSRLLIIIYLSATVFTASQQATQSASQTAAPINAMKSSPSESESVSIIMSQK
jgi:hypothetical protein